MSVCDCSHPLKEAGGSGVGEGLVIGVFGAGVSGFCVGVDGTGVLVGVKVGVGVGTGVLVGVKVGVGVGTGVSVGVKVGVGVGTGVLVGVSVGVSAAGVIGDSVGESVGVGSID